MKFEELRFLAVKVENEVEEKEVIRKMLNLANDEFESGKTEEEIEETIKEIDTGFEGPKYIVALIKEKFFGVDFKLASAKDVPKDRFDRIAVDANKFLTNDKELFNGSFEFENVLFKVEGKKVTGKHLEEKFKAIAVCSGDEFSLVTAMEIIGIKMQIKNYRRMLKGF